MEITGKTIKTGMGRSHHSGASSHPHGHKYRQAASVDRFEISSQTGKPANGVRGNIQDALNLAISRKDNCAVERLLGRGADINKPDPSTHLYPILVAANVGSSSEVFETVLRAKPNLEVTSPSALKLTAISHLALNADIHGVKRLLEEGASLGVTPFWEHPPYTIVAGVEDWHVHAEAFREISNLLENAAKLRDDYIPISE